MKCKPTENSPINMELPTAQGDRCPYCQSNRWIYIESSGTMKRYDASRGTMRDISFARYGCSKCGGDFLVEDAMRFKTTKDPNRCPHCSSPKVIVAVELAHGVVITCTKCNRLGLFSDPGFEGTITEKDLAAAGKLTPEALEFFGRRGVNYEIAKAKARMAAVKRPGNRKPMGRTPKS